MELCEVKPNNRIQVEMEHDDPSLRNVRGIVLAVGQKSIILVTDYGELLEVFDDRILSITNITMPRMVSDCLTELKNYYAEVYELELKLKSLREKEQKLKQDLYDASFLSKFNIYGAKNRLDKSIEPELMSFQKDVVSYQISFQANKNEHIEILVLVSNQIEYPDLDEIRDIDKIIRVHAPDVKELLEKCFPFASKPQELEKKVVHEKDIIYNVQTLYRMCVEVTKENFLEVREKIKSGLIKLQK